MKRNTSEELNKQWKAAEVPAQVAVVEQAIDAESIDPLPLVEDDDDGTAPF